MKNFDIKIEEEGNEIIITTTNVERKSKEDFVKTVLKRQTELSAVQNEVEQTKVELYELMGVDETEEEVFKHLEHVKKAEQILKKRKLLQELRNDTESLSKLQQLVDSSLPLLEKIKKEYSQK
jgi:hypothetical protein